MVDLVRPSKADLTLLQDRQIVVIGFGPMAKAHALNLRDSGVDVRVGLPQSSRQTARAEAEGLNVMDPDAAAQHCDLVALLDGEHATAAYLREHVVPHLEPGDCVLLGSPAPWRYGELGPVPDGVDVIVLQPLADGLRMRQEYQDGHGVPCLVGIAQEGSGFARATAAAYAQAMGCLRAGAIPVDVARAAEAEKFAAEGIRPVLATTLQEAFTTMVQAGYAPELAYLASVQDLLATAEAAAVDGLAALTGTRSGDGVDDAATMVRGRLAEHLQHELARIRGLAHGEQMDWSARASLEETGKEIRALMSWIRA